MPEAASSPDATIFQLEAPVSTDSADLGGINGHEMDEICSPEIIQLTEDTQHKLRVWLLNTPVFQGLDPRVRALYEKSEVEKWVSKTSGNPRHISFRPTAATPDGVVFRASTRTEVSARLEALFLENFPRAKGAGVDLELSYYVHSQAPEKKQLLPAPIFGEISGPKIPSVHYYTPPAPLLPLYKDLLHGNASGVYFIHQSSGSGGAEEVFLLEAQRIAKAHNMATGKLSCSGLKRAWQEVGQGKAQGEPIAEAFSGFSGKDRLIVLEHAEAFFRKSDGNLSGPGTIEKVMEQIELLLKQDHRKTVVIFVGLKSAQDLIRAASGTHDDIISPLRGAASIRMKTGHDSEGYDFSYDSQTVRRDLLLYHLQSSLSQTLLTSGSEALDLFVLQPELSRYNSSLFVSEGLSKLFCHIAPMKKLLKQMSQSESLFDIGSLSRHIQYHESDCDFDSFFEWLDEWIVQLLEGHFPDLKEDGDEDAPGVGSVMRAYLIVSSLIHLCADSYEEDLLNQKSPLSIIRERIFKKVFSKISGISQYTSLQFSEILVSKLGEFGVSDNVRFGLLNTVFSLGGIPYGNMSDWNHFVSEASTQIRSPKKLPD